MSRSLGSAFGQNFLGNSPRWYKLTVAGFLALNPLLLASVGPFITGWLMLGEFIFVLAMALKCYPLPPAGLIAVEAILLRLTDPAAVYDEVAANFAVLLLLMFMVAGVYFLQDGLYQAFARIVVGVRSKVALSLLFCLVGAVLSAFLDALTVTAVIVAVAYGLYTVYQRAASAGELDPDDEETLAEFRGFLRNLVMHGIVGTALGGATTLVGEPQNLIIGEAVGWDFGQFFLRTAHVSLPVFGAGLLTCWGLERFRLAGYGYVMPRSIRKLLVLDVQQSQSELDAQHWARLVIQGAVAAALVLALAFHVAEVGLVGLLVIVLLTALNGVTNEQQLGRAFHEALPFTALLVVFFAVVAMIHDQQLFDPITAFVFGLEGRAQLLALFVANGALSCISDNVFVATVYMGEAMQHFDALRASQGGQLTSDQAAQLNRVAVAINMGTNIPSVTTPNGQAAFLFLLTSSLAPLIGLSYMRMLRLALPYAAVMTLVAVAATAYWL